MGAVPGILAARSVSYRTRLSIRGWHPCAAASGATPLQPGLPKEDTVCCADFLRDLKARRLAAGGDYACCVWSERKSCLSDQRTRKDIAMGRWIKKFTERAQVNVDTVHSVSTLSASNRRQSQSLAPSASQVPANIIDPVGACPSCGSGQWWQLPGEPWHCRTCEPDMPMSAKTPNLTLPYSRQRTCAR